MSTPKRHHILPEFYLNGFCRDGLLWVYDRENDSINRQTPKATAVQKHYYTYIDKDGNKSVEIEKMLSMIEGGSKPVIVKLLDKQPISAADREMLALFCGFMWNRVPDFEKSVNQIQERLAKVVLDSAFCNEKRAAASIASYERKTGMPSGVTPADMVQINQEGYEVEVHRNFSLAMMVSISMKTAGYFKKMDWVFMHVPDRTSFVTCDDPMYVAPPPDHNPRGSYGYGVVTKGAVKVIPLHQKMCMLMFDHGDRVTHVDMDQNQIRLINLDIAYNTDRYLIGRDKEQVLNLAKTRRLAESKKKPRMRIN